MGQKDDRDDAVNTPKGTFAGWERLQKRFPGAAKSLQLISQIGSTVVTAGTMLVDNDKAKRELNQIYEELGQFETGK